MSRHRGASLCKTSLMIAGSLLLVGTSTLGSSSGALAASSSKKVVLQFWNAYNEQDSEASTMAKVIIPAFEKLHPNIQVKSIVYPYSALLSKLLASASAGDPPDLVRSDIIWLPQLAKMGVLLPLAKMPGFRQLAKQVYPGSLSTNYWAGHYYGLPLDTNTQVLFWNKADFKAAHISGPPKTMAELFSDAVKLTIPAKKQWGLSLNGGTDMWNIGPYVWSMGGSFTNATYKTALGYMDAQKTVGPLEKLVKLYKKGVISPDVLGGSGVVGAEQGFPKGMYAMYIDGPWGAQTYQTSFPHLQFGMEPMPAGKGGSVSVVGGEDVVIPAGTKHPAQAELFMKFLLSPFAQLAMVKAGQMSVLKDIGPQEAKIHSYYAPFAKQLLTSKARIPVPQYQQIDTDFSNALQQALRGKLSVSKAMLQAAKAANALLAQNQ